MMTNPRTTVLAVLLLQCLLSCTTSVQPEGSERIQFLPRDTVQLFAPGIISTRLNERDIAISPDSQEIMFTLSTMDSKFRAIVQIHLKDGNVSGKEIAPFSGQYNDIEPFYAPDGQKIFFSSTRPLHEKDSTPDYNIWYVEKISGQWMAEAKPIGDPINTDADEYYPAVAANGNLYFTASYKDAKGLEDIYTSSYVHGQYAIPVSLDSTINSDKYEFNAYISPKEDVLVFSSYGRQDDFGGGDLYISTKDEKGNWTSARNAGAAINSPVLDYCPFIDFNSSTFYFTSNRKSEINAKVNLQQFEEIAGGILNGTGNIYFIKLQNLGL